MGDEIVTSLFQHIRNRLDHTFEYGDVDQVITDNVPNHKTWEQSLREDKPGDVGIFETYTTETLLGVRGCYMYQAEIQIAVVSKPNDIDNCKVYLKNTLNNLRKNTRSSMYWFKDVRLVNLKPIGKNKDGNQMVVLNISVKYIENNNTW